MATATPTPVATAKPTATPVIVSPSPSPVPAETQALVAQPAPAAPVTLGQQLGEVDPLIWASFAGIFLIPGLMQLVKKFFVWLKSVYKNEEVESLGHRVNTALLAAVSASSAYLINALSSGVLEKLSSPLLALAITAGIIFATGTVSYQVVLKKDEEKAKALPVTTEP